MSSTYSFQFLNNGRQHSIHLYETVDFMSKLLQYFAQHKSIDLLVSIDIVCEICVMSLIFWYSKIILYPMLVHNTHTPRPRKWKVMSYSGTLDWVAQNTTLKMKCCQIHGLWIWVAQNTPNPQWKLVNTGTFDNNRWERLYPPGIPSLYPLRILSRFNINLFVEVSSIYISPS